MTKNDPKMTPYKFVQKVLKNQFSTGGSGGAKMIKIEGGVPGVHFYKFFEILQFSTKAPPLLTPKIDPQKGPYWKTHSPQIGCTFAPMGGSKMSLFGGSEGGPLGPKNVDTTI
jgi:hypothetical protein